MAEPLKNRFGARIPDDIGRMISRAFPAFEREAFVKEALVGYEALDLMQRSLKIAQAHFAATCLPTTRRPSAF